MAAPQEQAEVAAAPVEAPQAQQPAADQHEATVAAAAAPDQQATVESSPAAAAEPAAADPQPEATATAEAAVEQQQQAGEQQPAQSEQPRGQEPVNGQAAAEQAPAVAQATANDLTVGLNVFEREPLLSKVKALISGEGEEAKRKWLAFSQQHGQAGKWRPEIHDEAFLITFLDAYFDGAIGEWKGMIPWELQEGAAQQKGAAGGKSAGYGGPYKGGMISGKGGGSMHKGSQQGMVPGQGVKYPAGGQWQQGQQQWGGNKGAGKYW